jgi:hypothetical protein
MMRYSTIIFVLAVLLVSQFQQCEALALVPQSVRTALLSRLSPQLAPQTTAMMYAHSQPTHETDYDSESKYKNSDLIIDTTEFETADPMAAYRSQMLDLVYERSTQRLLE